MKTNWLKKKSSVFKSLVGLKKTMDGWLGFRQKGVETG